MAHNTSHSHFAKDGCNYNQDYPLPQDITVMDTLTSLKKVKEICRSCHYMDYYLDEDINCSNCGKSRLFEMRVVPPEQTTLTYIYRGKSASFTM